jgi:pimeloyl-ACP methyl ester carboxylesterase/DNA-binding CsgD family transcriptional regulator
MMRGEEPGSNREPARAGALSDTMSGESHLARSMYHRSGDCPEADRRRGAVDQKVRFTKSTDGVRIAYAECGAGPALVKAPNWLSHLEFDWQSPVWRHWFKFLSRGRRLVRFDARGCGLSDWTAADFSLDRHVADLEVVVETVGLERFALFGMSIGGPIAIEYACRHPQRVSQLILFGTSALGALRDPKTAKQARALFDLIPTGWTWETSAFRDLFAALYLPDGTIEQRGWFADLLRVTSKPEIGARMLEASGMVDIRDRLADVVVPTLVVHVSKDSITGFRHGLELAANIPGARLVEIDSKNHLLLEDEPGWARLCEVVDEFLGHKPASPMVDVARFGTLTARERDVLGHIGRGLANAEIATTLCISEKTVRNHVTNIFDKLGVDTRARAIVMARDAGLA